jgi:hypothetical protein
MLGVAAATALAGITAGVPQTPVGPASLRVLNTEWHDALHCTLPACLTAWDAPARENCTPPHACLTFLLLLLLQVCSTSLEQQL